MWILTWKLRRRKNQRRLLQLLRERLEQHSNRLDYLDSILPEYDPWNDDFRLLILLSDIRYLDRALEDLYPESIDPMINILSKESHRSYISRHILTLLSDVQEKKAVPYLLQAISNESNSEVLTEFLWYCGQFGRVVEIVDRGVPSGLIRYFDFDRTEYHAYLDDEDREKELQQWRLELLPEIEPYLTHPDKEVRITAFIAMRKIIPFEDHLLLDEFEKANPELNYKEIRLEYNPPSCYMPTRMAEEAISLEEARSS